MASLCGTQLHLLIVPVATLQMLRAGKARPQEPMQLVTPGGATRCESDGSDSEDRVPVPVFQNSFGDAIQKALDSYATHPGMCDTVRTVVLFRNK